MRKVIIYDNNQTILYFTGRGELNQKINQLQHHRQEEEGRFDYFGESADIEEDTELQTTTDDGLFPLSEAQPGMYLWVSRFLGKGGMSRMLAMGIRPRSPLKVLSIQPSGSVVVAIADSRLGLGAEIATRVMVTGKPEVIEIETETMEETNPRLQEMTAGMKGRIVGYDKTHRAYKSKLLSMGLTPGTEFTIIRVAPLGDPIEINLRGFHLSLRKQEADALNVEILEPN